MESGKQNGAAACNVCGASVDRVLLVKQGHTILQCDACGLAFTHPQPVALAEQYDSGYFDLYRRRKPFRIKRAHTRLSAVELMIAPGRLLDIGCSLGYFVEGALQRGWQASGIEISPHAAEEARSLGLDVKTGVLEDAVYPDASFDCVTMWDVLEHVPDPTFHMREVRRILKPGGIVAIGTPNLGHTAFRTKRENWRHLKPSEHIFYFEEQTLSRLFEKTGFKQVAPSIIPKRRFPGWPIASIRAWLYRTLRLNDVLIVYAEAQ